MKGLEVVWPVQRAGAHASVVGFNVAEEARVAAALPISGLVGIDAGARTQHAEKRMPLGIGHDACMSDPDDQVSSLRSRHPAKFVDPYVKIGGAGVGIRETGVLIKRVHEVRTIGAASCNVAKIERGA